MKETLNLKHVKICYVLLLLFGYFVCRKQDNAKEMNENELDEEFKQIVGYCF